MTRQPHDQYSKECLIEILKYFDGRYEAQRPIHPKEVYYADISFEPAPTISTDDLKKIGILGNIISSPCLIEYFWTPPTRPEICLCLMKLFSWYGDLLREANRNKEPLDENKLPRLWILTTSIPDSLLKRFDVKTRQAGWCKGFHFFGEAMNTGIVAIDRLPETLETVWMRIFGKGKIQQKAIKTFATLKYKGPLLDNVLDIFHKWHEDTKAQDHLTPEDEELLMILSPAYEKSRTQALLEGMLRGQKQGVQQGHLEERHSVVEKMLKLRFGVDETLSQVIEPLVQLPQEESLRLLMQASRYKLLERLGKKCV